MNKPQILYIHGGSTYRSRKDFLATLKVLKISIEKRIRWSDDFLDQQLGDKFDIIRPKMPLKEFARYSEWKIFFEHYFPYLRDGIVLIGSSLGGIFLAKYLSENKFPIKISSLVLVAPPFDNSLSSEELVGGFKLKSNLLLISQNCPQVNLLFSEDDPLATLAHAQKYRQKLPQANFVFFQSKNGHFKVSEFPEIIEMIKHDTKNSHNNLDKPN
jgi:predicted alpha/beta hydrolase family esterase